MRSLSKTTELRLINLRWLSVLGMLAVALFSPSLIGSFALVPRLLALGLIVGGMNLVLWLVATRTRETADGLPMLSAFIQLCIDLLAWASYVYLSGGATNPLITVFLPLVAIGAMVLDRLHAWALGVMAALAYTYLWFVYQPLAIPDALLATRLHIFGMWLVFVVSDAVVIWFMVQMRAAIQVRDAALNEAREKAIRNDWVVSMGSLAAGAAHELSTPLGTINVLVDDLLEDVATPTALRPDLDLIRRQIEACKRTLTHLTERAGCPRGAPTDREAASVWLKRLVDSWLALNAAANVRVDLDERLERCRVGLDLPVERAIAGLLDNAHQVGAAQITVTARIKEAQIELCVDDDGPGITPAMIALFEAGQPMNSARGMGVGLLLARTAIERCGGALSLQAGVGGGTRATVILPAELDAKTHG